LKAYYHGYVLATMAVRQTRQHFIKKYGSIVDNEMIGKDLASIYWTPGNGKMFLELVKDMTGSELNGNAWVNDLKEPLESKLKREKNAYEQALKIGPKFCSIEECDGLLNLNIVLAHGDDVIATEKSSMMQQFKKFLKKQKNVEK
jgi:hypothetical protein